MSVIAAKTFLNYYELEQDLQWDATNIVGTGAMHGYSFTEDELLMALDELYSDLSDSSHTLYSYNAAH